MLGIRAQDPMNHPGPHTLPPDFGANTPTNPYNTGTPSTYAHFAQHSRRPHEQHQQPPQPQQQWMGPNMVPPTPTSIEMQPGHAHPYPQGLDLQQQQQMYEHYRRIQKDQVNFTPLISPAVTPLETNTRYHDYSNEAFSPLTSPALRAQSHTASHSAYGSVRGSDTSATTSPHDLNYEYPPPTSASGSIRRSRRKMSTSSAKTSARAVKQSPAMKPQHKKKQTSSTVIPSKEVATVLEEAGAGSRADQPPHTSSGSVSRGDGSMTESMSPEALSDILMPPPATPQSSSAGRSPQIDPMISQAKPQAEQNEEPATPASLMRIRKQAQQASTRKRGLSKSKTIAAAAILAQEHPTDGMEMSETTPPVSNNVRPPSSTVANGKALPSRGPQSISLPASATQTAASSTLPSPVTGSFASPTGLKAGKTSDNKFKGREPKKRGNGPSEKASPAIRPRISPSIKPLLPEGGSYPL